MSRRILVVGDGVVSTGFAKANHAYCAGLQTAGHEVHLMAMHFSGDTLAASKYPYAIWTCWHAGDPFGIRRIRHIVDSVQPDAIIITQDPWNFPQYLARLADFKHIPVIGVVAVDGLNCQGYALGPIEGKHPGLSHAIFWTQFGADEARAGGWKGRSSIVPLGVDLNVYRPLDVEALRRQHLHRVLDEAGLGPDTYLVGSVGRNQSRKRLDLTMQYFAEWIQRRNIRDACLWMHIAPTGDDAYDIGALARYYGIAGRVLVPDVNMFYGVSEVQMAEIYNLFSVFLLTGMGEGWSLPTLEAMACGIPCIVPDSSALGEWARPAAAMCECTHYDVTPNVNTIGGRVGGHQVIEYLSRLYHEPHSRKAMSEAGIALASQPQYRWEHIGARVAEVVDKVLAENVPGVEAAEVAHAV